MKTSIKGEFEAERIEIKSQAAFLIAHVDVDGMQLEMIMRPLKVAHGSIIDGQL